MSAPVFSYSPRRTVGFTIVELLIVVVVIAILAAITIVAFRGIQERAKTSVINDSASSWAKVLQMQITQGAQISLNAACLGRAATDFPPKDGFADKECLQVIKNGAPLMSVLYDSATLSGWKGSDQPPSGALPITSVTFKTGSDTYLYRARGLWLSGNGVAWVPVVMGQCGPGESIVASAGAQLDGGSYGGDICRYGF